MEENNVNPQNISPENTAPENNYSEPITPSASSFLSSSPAPTEAPVKEAKIPEKSNLNSGVFIFLLFSLILVAFIAFFLLKRKVSPPNKTTGQITEIPAVGPTETERKEESEEATPMESITKAEVVTGCKVKIQTSDKTVFVETNIGYQGFSFNCDQLLLQVSPSGRFVIFQDLYTGNNAMLTLFSVANTDNYVLDYFGQAEVLDMKFISADILFVLYKDSKGQYLKSYDLVGLIANYPANIGAYKMFTDLDKSSRLTELPNIGQASKIVIKGSKLQVIGLGKDNVLKEYALDTVMPPLQSMKK